jgi:hypothetical protein
MSANPFEAGSAANGQPSARPQDRSRSWIWFFVIVAVLTVVAIIILGVFKFSFQPEQLTPERLAAARKLWREQGPRSYILRYTEQGNVNGEYTVRVENGEVVSAEPDIRPIEKKREYYGMPAFFRYVEGFLKMDAKPGSPRTDTRATFDLEDGHLVHYYRRVVGTRENLEITVELKKIDDSKTKP